MKKVIISVDYGILKEFLHLPDDINIDLVYTPDERETYKPNEFVLILSGDGLDPKFTVREGCKIMHGCIQTTTKTDVITTIEKVEIF